MNTQTLPFSIKSISDTGVIEGVISAFGKIDAYGDSIERGAYARSIANLAKSGRALPLLYQHDPARPIGVWTDLREGDTGLHGIADLAMEVRDAQEAHALARKGALTGISIGYTVPAGGAKKQGNVRILTDIELHEASLVTFPADTHARVTAVKAVGCARDIAELLQDAGISGRKARAAAGAAWKALNETGDDADLTELAALLRESQARIAGL